MRRTCSACEGSGGGGGGGVCVCVWLGGGGGVREVGQRLQEWFQEFEIKGGGG